MLDDRAQVLRIVRGSAWFMRALEAGAALGLPDGSWCIGAGALRNLVWDHLHGHADRPSALSDVDFAHFDAADLSAASDQALQARLRARCPELPWEVTNQAAVHLWFERHFGHPVDALPSLAAAVATWPEYATAVAVTRDRAGRLALIAPHGLDDLLRMRIRHNPLRASRDTFLQRTAQKRYQERWPRVQVTLPAP
jgi:hypothetical protein